jgi:hypothetical protein
MHKMNCDEIILQVSLQELLPLPQVQVQVPQQVLLLQVPLPVRQQGE